MEIAADFRIFSEDELILAYQMVNLKKNIENISDFSPTSYLENFIKHINNIPNDFKIKDIITFSMCLDCENLVEIISTFLFKNCDDINLLKCLCPENNIENDEIIDFVSLVPLSRNRDEIFILEGYASSTENWFRIILTNRVHSATKTPLTSRDLRFFFF